MKVGKIYYGNGTYLNEEVVRAGYAWHYLQYAPNDPDIKQAEVAAKDQKKCKICKKSHRTCLRRIEILGYVFIFNQKFQGSIAYLS
ncbi:thermonuclease family protein [Ilyobacter polytropus]|uniref:thermonuclease family protein n=1 Tax=Ilyobacter polytropus TaxID=167642 RepID=UPI000A02C918